jgi:hypothetical protein
MFWIVAVRFWISCIWAARNYWVVGSIVGLRGGGGAWFCWLAIWVRTTGGMSWPPPDLVFTIWLLEKGILDRNSELMHEEMNSKRWSNMNFWFKTDSRPEIHKG